MSNQRARNNRRAVIILAGFIVAVAQAITLINGLAVYGIKPVNGPGTVIVELFGSLQFEVSDIPQERFSTAFDLWNHGSAICLFALAIICGVGVAWLLSRLWPPPRPRAEITSE